jgi:hypothetical protein
VRAITRVSTLLTIFVLIISATPSHVAAQVHQAKIAELRHAPGEIFLTKRGLRPDTQGRYRMRLATRPFPIGDGTHGSLGGAGAAPEGNTPWSLDQPGRKTSATLNCGNDNLIDSTNSLVLSPGDAAGTIFGPVPGLSKLVVQNIRFGVLGLQAVYPGTMTADFWQAVGTDEWEFVVGTDITIPTDPGLVGDIYEVDVSSLGIVTANEMMVLLYDANPQTGIIVPAGDASPSCFNGVDFCSVLLPAGGATLYLYGLVDAAACPSAAGNIQLFDLVVEVDYFLDSPTDAPAPGRALVLHDAQPNPFNPSTSISYSIAKAAPVSLRIYDLAGRLVLTLVEGEMDAGNHTVRWDGRSQDGVAVASGVYLYRLEIPGFVETRRMVLLK